MSQDASHDHPSSTGDPSPFSRADGAHLILAALDHLSGVSQSSGGPSGPPPLARQTESLRQWARSLGLQLNPETFLPRLERGGQEHDFFHANQRVFDAHTKNLVRFEDTLIPFDVIPCHPAGGFLQFITDTLATGHTLSAIRTITTTSGTNAQPT